MTMSHLQEARSLRVHRLGDLRKLLLRRFQSVALILPLVAAGSLGCQGVRHPMMQSNDAHPGKAMHGGMTPPSASKGTPPAASLATFRKSQSHKAAPSQAELAAASQRPLPTKSRATVPTTSESIVQASAAETNGPPAMVQQAGHRGSHPANCACCRSSRYKPIFSGALETSPEVCGPEGAESCGPVEGMCEQPGVFRGYDPQEYIYDGGDRLPKVVIQNDGSAAGLQPEDTVIQYETESGCVKVEPACRAAIYAPRFASVRKITSVEKKELALGPKAAILPQGPDSVSERLPSPTVRQPLRVASEDGLRVIEAFRDRNRGVPMEKVLPVRNFSDALLPFEDLQLIRDGKVRLEEAFQLKKGVAAALTWSTVDELQVFVDGKEAVVQRTTQTAQETVLYEIDGKPCVRICKVASQQMAAPGDEIHFTIRVDNIGSRDVANVVVLDSLAPRLEYVEDSQKASFETDFEIKDNEVGSSILQWKLKNGLKALDGGYICFKCRVR